MRHGISHYPPGYPACPVRLILAIGISRTYRQKLLIGVSAERQAGILRGGLPVAAEPHRDLLHDLRQGRLTAPAVARRDDRRRALR